MHRDLAPPAAQNGPAERVSGVENAPIGPENAPATGVEAAWDVLTAVRAAGGELRAVPDPAGGRARLFARGLDRARHAELIGLVRVLRAEVLELVAWEAEWAGRAWDDDLARSHAHWALRRHLAITGARAPVDPAEELAALAEFGAAWDARDALRLFRASLGMLAAAARSEAIRGGG